MPQQIVIAEQLRIAAVLKDERVDELIVAQGRYQVGDVYLGTVENVHPGLDAAFVRIGEGEKNGFLPIKDLGPLRLKKGAAEITDLLKPLQKVLVQIIKEPTGNKGPTLTGNLSLPGRYLVLQPHGEGVSLSGRIKSEEERNRLRALGVLIKPPSHKLIFRSEATGIKEEFLIADLEKLHQEWEAIDKAFEQNSPPLLLKRDADFVHRVLRDHTRPNLERVVVDEPSGVERVSGFLAQNGQNVLVELYKEPGNLLDHFRINLAINDALKPRVDLPSGGYIIIEPTEALTVIDVNSGSFTASKSQDTILWTNTEAATEIARQLKLRNIGGIIIVDFIDMDSRRDKLQILEHFTSAIREDALRPKIFQLTELGLVELTRKRQGQNIYELFAQSCQSCGGLGNVALLPGKELLQPLATATGLIRSISSNKIGEQISLEATNLPRKRIGKSSRSNEIHSPTIPGTSLSTNLNDSSTETSTSEVTNHRQEPELIGVPMEPEQEEVFSFLGLNPLLLLDPIPTNENLLVRVIRPEEEVEIVLEESRKQLAANATRRRKKGRTVNGTNRVITRSSIESASSISSEELSNLTTEESKKEDTYEEISESEESQQSTDPSLSEAESSSKEEAEVEEPRRRRRRSSASTENGS